MRFYDYLEISEDKNNIVTKLLVIKVKYAIILQYLFYNTSYFIQLIVIDVILTLRFIMKQIFSNSNHKEILHPLLCFLIQTLSCKIINIKKLNQSQDYYLLIVIIRFDQANFTIFYELIQTCNLSLFTRQYQLIKFYSMWIINIFLIQKYGQLQERPPIKKLRLLASFHQILYLLTCLYYLKNQISIRDYSQIDIVDGKERKQERNIFKFKLIKTIVE